MEYVAGGNLLQRMRVRMSFDDIANLANQTLAALVFLHDQGVMHRDIKPANILCVTPNHYKLADFGVSKEVTPLLSKQGTAEYMAPEVHGQAPYSYPADMWSLGVVLFQCMDGLPDGRPGPDGQEWCQEVFRKFIKYHWKCEALRHMNGDIDFELILLVKDAMLHMDPDDRWSAQKCLRWYRYLWKDIGSGEDSDVGSGANTPTQAHPNGSFPPPALSTSVGDEAGEETSIIVRPVGRKPQLFRNEERSVVGAQGRARSSFRGSFPPSLPSIGGGQIYDPSIVPSPPSIDGGKAYDLSSGASFPPPIDGGKFYDPSTVIHRSPSSGGGKLYDPGHFFSSSPSVSAVQKHTRSISDGSIKRRRDSHASADGKFNDGSVTPGRRAPYRPGNEVAAPGLDYFPANQWAKSSASNHKRSRSSTSKPNAAAQGRPIQRSQSSNLARQSAKEAYSST